MSRESEFKKNVKQYQSEQAAAENARKMQQEKAANAARVQSLKDSITAIQGRIIAPAKADLNAAEAAAYPLQQAFNAEKTGANNPATLAAILSQLAPYTKTITDKKKVISDAEKSIEKIKLEIKNRQGQKLWFPNSVPRKNAKTPPGGNKQPQVPQSKLEFSKDYRYNAPMVSTAYFQNSSLENTVLDGKLVDQGKYGDAKTAWQGTTGGRGTIQMDRKFLSTFTTSASSSSNKKIDTQKYGFKFLYNPQTISMSWGVMTQMDPVYEATNYDKFQVVSAGLMSATVDFEILLNRIKDFDYLNEYGLSGKLNSGIQRQATAYLGEAARDNYGINPYPENVSTDDLVEIYNKGTMYDLEYFFKTINGPDGTFVSQLNGTTADKAYLRPTIVELHLGNKLRYRVRVSSFSVNHIIFNNRMVPMLSTVRLSCNRFVDGPQSNINSSGGIKTPPSGLDNLRNQVPGYGR